MQVENEWLKEKPKIIKEMYKKYSEYLGEIISVVNNSPYILSNVDIIIFAGRKKFEKGMDVFKIHNFEINFGVTCNGEYFCKVQQGFIEGFRELWTAQEEQAMNKRR